MVDYFKQFMSPYVIGEVNISKMIINIPKIENETLLIEKRKFLSTGLEQLAIVNNHLINLRICSYVFDETKFFISQCYWNKKPCPGNFSELVFTNLGQCIVINPSKYFQFIN